mmetsp:Transcript_94893/g.217283  ORF Transcript_94893/g.217283 Transcript_94893/m.217283 type:complete len:251 (+) Transcript_94893:537-1289(+)
MGQIGSAEPPAVCHVASGQGLGGLRDMPGVRVQGPVKPTRGLHGVEVSPVGPPALHSFTDHINDSTRLISHLRTARGQERAAPRAPGPGRPGGPGRSDRPPRLRAPRGRRRRAGRGASCDRPPVLVRPADRLLHVIQDRPVVRDKPPRKIADVHGPLVRAVHRGQEGLRVLIGAVDLELVERKLQVFQGDEPIPIHVQLLEQLGGLQLAPVGNLDPLHSILNHFHAIPSLPVVVQAGTVLAVGGPLPAGR